MKVRDAPAQDSAEPGADTRRVFERPGTLRSSHHRALNDVFCVCLGRKPPPSHAHEPSALVGKMRDEEASVHGF